MRRRPCGSCPFGLPSPPKAPMPRVSCNSTWSTGSCGDSWGDSCHRASKPDCRAPALYSAPARSRASCCWAGSPCTGQERRDSTEEMVTVTAPWIEAGRGTTPLKPFGTRGEETTMAQVEAALRDPRRPPAGAVDRIRAWAAKDAADLEPELRRRAAEAREDAAKSLAERGEREAADLRDLIAAQLKQVAEGDAKPEDMQLDLFGADEAAQRRRDRLHWRRKLTDLQAHSTPSPPACARLTAYAPIVSKSSGFSTFGLGATRRGRR